MLTRVETFPLVQSPLFNEEKWLIHGFGIKDIPIERYLNAFGVSDSIVPATKQVHGNRVHIITKRSLALLGPPPSLKLRRTSQPQKEPGTFLEADALLTEEPNVVCWVRTADCVPILLADSRRRVIGAVHSGWRGTAQKIILEVLSFLQKEWRISPEDLKIAIGPAIGGHCYQVGSDVKQAFEKAKLYPSSWMKEAWVGRWDLDLAFANLDLLMGAGVLKENVYLSLACTACDMEKFASYRREGNKRGEQVNWIVKRENGE